MSKKTHFPKNMIAFNVNVTMYPIGFVRQKNL